MTFSTSAVAVCCCRDCLKFVEQPRVLDGDDGLGGEVLHQRDLLVGERPNLLAVDDDSADQRIIFEHRHAIADRAPPNLVAGARIGSGKIVGRCGQLL